MGLFSSYEGVIHFSDVEYADKIRQISIDELKHEEVQEIRSIIRYRVQIWLSVIAVIHSAGLSIFPMLLKLRQKTVMTEKLHVIQQELELRGQQPHHVDKHDIFIACASSVLGSVIGDGLTDLLSVDPDVLNIGTWLTQNIVPGIWPASDPSLVSLESLIDKVVTAIGLPQVSEQAVQTAGAGLAAHGIADASGLAGSVVAEDTMTFGMEKIEHPHTPTLPLSRNFVYV